MRHLESHTLLQLSEQKTDLTSSLMGDGRRFDLATESDERLTVLHAVFLRIDYARQGMPRQARSGMGPTGNVRLLRRSPVDPGRPGTLRWTRFNTEIALQYRASQDSGSSDTWSRSPGGHPAGARQTAPRRARGVHQAGAGCRLAEAVRRSVVQRDREPVHVLENG